MRRAIMLARQMGRGCAGTRQSNRAIGFSDALLDNRFMVAASGASATRFARPSPQPSPRRGEGVDRVVVVVVCLSDGCCEARGQTACGTMLRRRGSLTPHTPALSSEERGGGPRLLWGFVLLRTRRVTQPGAVFRDEVRQSPHPSPLTGGERELTEWLLGLLSAAATLCVIKNPDHEHRCPTRFRQIATDGYRRKSRRESVAYPSRSVRRRLCCKPRRHPFPETCRHQDW